MRQPFFRQSKGTWYVWHQGKLVSLRIQGQGNEAEAMQAWHRLMAGLETQPKPQPCQAPALPQPGWSIAELIKGFLAHAKRWVKPCTAQWYAERLEPFATAKGQASALALKPEQAEAYAESKGWSKSTRHGFLSALAVAYRWAERHEHLPYNPLKALRKPGMASRGQKAIISAEDHAKLLLAAKPAFAQFLQLLHWTGARPSEIANITAESLDAQAGVVRLAEHKTARHGKDRLIFLPSEAVALLAGLKAKRPQGPLLRNSQGKAWTRNAIRLAMQRARAKAKVPHAVAYGYRHSFATEALAKGVPDAQVAALLGHSGTAMLHRHYAHLTGQTQAMRQALALVRG